MQEIFTYFSQTLQGTAGLALIAAFVWGILSVLLSPCHLASIPLIVGFIDNQEVKSAKRAFVLSTLFSLGILLSIAVIGVVTSAMGRIAGNLGPYSYYFVSVIFILVGLHLLDVIPINWAKPSAANMKQKGYIAAFILGAVFGIALGPCTFAYLAPILAITFKTASTGMSYGLLLLAVYGIGHCSVIVAAGTCTEVLQKYLNWTDGSKGAVILKRTCGVLVILAGLYILYIAP